MKRIILAVALCLAATGANSGGTYNPPTPGSIGGMTIDASNATLPDARTNLGIKSISIKDYGAVCDGTSRLLSSLYATLAEAQAVYPTATALTNELDGVAINNALEAARTAPAFGGQRPARVVFPQGICLSNTSINATNLRGSAVELEFDGNFIRSSAAGLVAFDALGSQRLKINKLTLWGDTGADAPKVGLQIGRTDVAASNQSDDNVLHEVTAFGSFTQSAFQNFASEALVAIHPFFSSDVAGSYPLIQDGLNHWNFTSLYVTQSAPTDTPQSFTENQFVGGQFRSAGGAGAIWMANTRHHQYLGGYALATTGTHGVALYSIDGTDTNSMLRMDINIEDASLTSAFLLMGTNASPTIPALHYHADTSDEVTSIFALDAGVTSAKLPGLDVAIRNMPVGTPTLFDTGSAYTVSGNILLPARANWSQPGSFLSGQVCFVDGATCRGAGVTLLASNNTAIVNTAISTSEVSLVAIPIPPLLANDSLRITTLWSTAGTATNTKNSIVRLAATACPTPGAVCTTGSVVLNGVLNTASLVGENTQTIVRMNNATNAQKFFSNGNTTGLGAVGTNPGTAAIGLSAGGFLNINCITATASTDTCTLEGYTVELIPGK